MTRSRRCWAALAAVITAVTQGSVPVARAATPPTVAAAGDIACDPNDASFNGGAGTAKKCRMRATSDLLVALAPDAVLPLGDTQYNRAAATAYQVSYRPTWGRLDAVAHPVAGNHEYQRNPSGYYAYFGAAAGAAPGWYSWDLGGWHLVALNSNCSAVGGCGKGSAQEQWLLADLAAHPAACTLAYWHHSRFSSGANGDAVEVAALYQDLYDAGADVVLAAHNHHYERFAPLDPAGRSNPSRGLRQFVVGTGGKSLEAFPTVRAGSEVRSKTFGVLALTLNPGSYDWRFHAVAGSSFSDTGTGPCH